MTGTAQSPAERRAARARAGDRTIDRTRVCCLAQQKLVEPAALKHAGAGVLSLSRAVARPARHHFADGFADGGQAIRRQHLVAEQGQARRQGFDPVAATGLVHQDDVVSQHRKTTGRHRSARTAADHRDIGFERAVRHGQAGRSK